MPSVGVEIINVNTNQDRKLRRPCKNNNSFSLSLCPFRYVCCDILAFAPLIPSLCLGVISFTSLSFQLLFTNVRMNPNEACEPQDIKSDYWIAAIPSMIASLRGKIMSLTNIRSCFLLFSYSFILHSNWSLIVATTWHWNCNRKSQCSSFQSSYRDKTTRKTQNISRL